MQLQQGRDHWRRSAGSMLIKELKNHADMNMVPVVMVDDDKTKHGTTINGVPVVAKKEKNKGSTKNDIK